MPEIHIVGGFLGSGKTTAIAVAAKQLMAQGKRVGVVTNDQGKYLVDTAFFELADLPTVEVTGGCFCCNYDDLEARLAALHESAQPDVIFAESVGSCADVVATVVKPLLELGKNGLQPTSFTVFADSRLLQQRLLDLPMPFSEDVVYIFDKQIEEAGLLVMNKVDLLDETAVSTTHSLAQSQHPNKQILRQNSLDETSVAKWLNLLAVLAEGTIAIPHTPLEIDYDRYGAGEAELAWLDEEITLHIKNNNARDVVMGLLGEIETAVRAQNWSIGHLKFIIRSSAGEGKVSFTTLGTSHWQNQLPEIAGSEVQLLVNGRIATQSATLEKLVSQLMGRNAETLGFAYETKNIASFHPGYPAPTHRI